MYQEFFSLKEPPFSISPDPEFLFLSERHKEALAHLRYGLQGNGGFVLLTGEVGTGKTTVCRVLLEEMPEQLDVAFILNPALTEIELLATVCDQFNIDYPQDQVSLKLLFDALTAWMMDNHHQGRSALVLIDEAQHLSFSVLEQLRLLTNIESSNKKPLQVILVGQTELQQKLKQTELRQLAQRITARYHLLPLTQKETQYYIQHRLSVAGASYPIFEASLLKRIFKYSQGIPRLINLICDRCLLCAYSENAGRVSPKMLKIVLKEMVFSQQFAAPTSPLMTWWRFSLLVVLILLTGWKMPEISNYFSSFTEVAKVTVATQADVVADIPETDVVVANIIHEEEFVIADEVVQEDLFDTFQGSDEAAVEELNAQSGDTVTLITQGERYAYSQQQEDNWFDDYWQLDFTHVEFAHALSTLYAVWGYQVDLVNATCAHGLAASLLCFSEHSNIEKLKQLNYPAVIKLEYEDQYVYLVIYKYADKYQLLIGEQSISVSESWLQRYWHGGLTLLWKTPFILKETLKFGQESDQVAWLNQQLNQIYSRPATNKMRFDSTLLRQVKQFQRDNFLIADGIVGARTLMVIMQKISLELPRLYTED